MDIHKKTRIMAGCLAAAIVFLLPAAAPAQLETYTHRLAQSTADHTFWTTPPSERVFPDDAVPTETDTLVRVYAARSEFEPFQIVVNPAASGSVTVSIGTLGGGMETEIHQVKTVDIAQATDGLGRTGPYPDPLWPVENGASVPVFAGENTAFWFTVHVPDTGVMGDYTADVAIAGVSIPVSLHVFDFAVPTKRHVKSQMNFSHQAVLSKYSVPGADAEYWMYVDKMKQYFIDHRLTPKSVLWPGGLTTGGGDTFLEYDCDAGVIGDPYGIWGFESPAERYLEGTGLMSGTFSSPFNGGAGFPSFMAITFQNNDPAVDQRPATFCGATRSSADWYTADNPSSAYNQKWFAYMADTRDYLSALGYLDEAYHYVANEPQDQADYDAVAWYSRYLKQAAPDLKLMVSEPPRSEIHDHADYVYPRQIDIWLPVLHEYDPAVSHGRETGHGEETWIYFLHGTRPPYFNPITLDHPGIESLLTGWFLWKYRIRGIAYYALNDWSRNPWTDPMTDNHNGDLFMLYPPSETNTAIAYGSNGHRFVPSIRFELMRDSLEMYEYLYLLNGGTPPAVGTANPSDVQADKIITGLTSYTRDSGFLYNLRRLIGLKLGNEIGTIPDIEPPSQHPRAEGPPGNYYINFQDPDGNPAGDPLVVDGKTYMKIGWTPYDRALGYGWYGDMDHVLYQWLPSGPNDLQRSVIYDDWGRRKTFEFDLPNGTYGVTVSVGWQGGFYPRNSIEIEGVTFVDDEASDPYLVRTRTVTVADNKLTMAMGIFDEYTMLNYLDIEAAGPVADFSATPRSGAAPLTVRFTDASANGPTSWEWDFDGDGGVDSTARSPARTYDQGGRYTVSLTVSNADGSHTETKIDHITVFGTGDYDCDGTVDLGDAIAVLKVLAGSPTDNGTCPDLIADLDDDGRLGPEDAVGVLQMAAGVR